MEQPADKLRVEAEFYLIICITIDCSKEYFKFPCGILTEKENNYFRFFNIEEKPGEVDVYNIYEKLAPYRIVGHKLFGGIKGM